MFSSPGCWLLIFDQQLKSILCLSLTFFWSPRRVPLLYLQTVMGDVVRTLKVMYGSLDRLVGLLLPVLLLREQVEASSPPRAVVPTLRRLCHQFLFCSSPCPLQCLLHGGPRAQVGPLLLPVLPAAHPAFPPEGRLLSSQPRCFRDAVSWRTAGSPMAHAASRNQGAFVVGFSKPGVPENQRSCGAPLCPLLKMIQISSYCLYLLYDPVNFSHSFYCFFN